MLRIASSTNGAISTESTYILRIYSYDRSSLASDRRCARSGRGTAISAVRNDDNPATASNSPKNHMLRFISNYMIAYFPSGVLPKQVPRNTGK